LQLFEIELRRSPVSTDSRFINLHSMGTVVEIYAPDAVEVEFVVASGRTKALLTLKVSDIRAIRGSDMPAIRSARHRT
jgi:hypothetical protein